MYLEIVQTVKNNIYICYSDLLIKLQKAGRVSFLSFFPHELAHWSEQGKRGQQGRAGLSLRKGQSLCRHCQTLKSPRHGNRCLCSTQVTNLRGRSEEPRREVGPGFPSVPSRLLRAQAYPRPLAAAPGFTPSPHGCPGEAGRRVAPPAAVCCGPPPSLCGWGGSREGTGRREGGLEPQPQVWAVEGKMEALP